MANERNELEIVEAILGRRFDRRDFLRLTGYAGTAAGVTAFLAACGPAASSAAPSVTAKPVVSAAPSTPVAPSASAAITGRPIKIGYVSPKTGPFSAFGEADEYAVGTINEALAGGLDVGGTLHPVEVLVKDSQSDPNRAAEVAGELILDDAVDLILVSSTPETTNPVTSQAEANQVPAISTITPWQPYYFGRQADPANPVPFDWTYHFFWGLEDIMAVFLDMWDQVATNKQVGGLFPNDGDGQAWSGAFPDALKAGGYTINIPPLYETGSKDFSAQINAFKQAGVEVLTGVPIPPDFTTFWTQAQQQGLTPKVVSMGKALLFPASVDALGPDAGDGLSSEVWWSPSHPFTSSLTGQSAKELGDAYTAATGKQWTQPLGFAHAIFEVAADALKRSGNVDDKAAIRDAIKATAMDTIVGNVDWTQNTPVPNVAKTPLVGGQWGKGTTNPYELVIVSNKDHPEIPAGGQMRPIGG
jgi:branched-chain amino acid transport system substrate-binding protein